jgi:hypothetical protein
VASNDRQGGFTRQEIRTLTASALDYCESQLPMLSNLPRRSRIRGEKAIEFGLTEILDSSREDSGHVRVDEKYWTDYFADSATREIPLWLQKELIQCLTSSIMNSMWQGVGADTARTLIEITAYAQEYRDRISAIAVAVYGRHSRAVSGDLDARRLQADSLIDGVPDDTGDHRYVVLVLDVLPPDLLDKVMETHHDALATRRGNSSVVIVRVPAAQDLGDRLISDRSERIGVTCRQLANSLHLFVAAVGAESSDGVPAAYAEAGKNHEAASALVAPPSVVLPRSVALERHLLADDEFALAVRAPLLPLLESPNLIGTLRCFIACDLDRTATAKSLQVDRRSLTYRLEKIKSLTGFDPRGARDFQVLANSLVAHDIHERKSRC